MADDANKNKLADKGPSLLEQAQHGVRNWWNGLGDDMRGQVQRQRSQPWWGDQAWPPNSNSMASDAFKGLSTALAGTRMGRFPEATVDMGMVRRSSQPAKPGEFPSHIMDPRVTSKSISSVMDTMYPGSMRSLSNPELGAGKVAYPEEVGFWARQVPANVTDAAAMAPKTPKPTGDPYLDAQLKQAYDRNLARRGAEGERPYDVIPGGKP
jgi:hypothetical protein